MGKLTPDQLKKRQESKMAKKALEAELHKKEQYNWQIKQMREVRPHTPAYTLKVGDLVMMSRGRAMTVTEVFDEGMFYRVDYDYIEPKTESSKERRIKGSDLWYWHDLQPFVDKSVVDQRPIFSKFNHTRLNFSQREIAGLLSVYYRWNLEMSPSYQRGDVWTQADKELLIDSVFNNRDIGKFVIIMRPFSEEKNAPQAEILDGKQRLTAIVEFYENRITFRGLFFKDLHWRDQVHFKRFLINWAELGENTTLKEKLRYFLDLNVAGVPQSVEHLEYVAGLLRREENNA